MQNDNNVTDCRIKRTAINKNSSYSIIERPTKGLLIIEKGTLIWESPTTIEMLHPGDILYHQQGSYALKTLDYESQDVQILINDF